VAGTQRGHDKAAPFRRAARFPDGSAGATARQRRIAFSPKTAWPGTWLSSIRTAAAVP
jgi:hypothetical protein